MSARYLMTAMACATLGVAPALAQGRSGTPGGPIFSPPPGETERDISARQFARDLAGPHRVTAEQYLARAQKRRAEALADAAAARSGHALRAGAARDIRAALKTDLLDWRAAFEVDRREWQAMRDQWLANRDGLTAAQWAERRAAWFAARDAWIARRSVARRN